MQRVGGQPREIKAFTQSEVGRTPGFSIPVPLLGFTVLHPTLPDNSKGVPKRLLFVFFNLACPTRPPQRCPLGEPSNPQDKASSGCPRSLHPSGLPVAAGAAQLGPGTRRAGSTWSIAPTSQTPNFPNLKARRRDSRDGRAPLDPGAPRSPPAPFPPAQASSSRRSGSGALAASPSSRPPGAACTVRASPLCVPSPVALPPAIQVSRARRNCRPVLRPFTSRPPASRTGDPLLTSPHP